MVSKGTARIACAVGAACLLFSAADASQPRLRDVERRRARAEASRKEIEADARKSARAVDDLRRSLVVAAAQQRLAEDEVARLETAVAALSAEQDRVRAERNASQDRLERALVVLYRRQPGRPEAALAAAVGRDSVTALDTLDTEEAAVTSRWQSLQHQKAELADARRDLADRRATLASLLDEAQRRETSLNRGLVAALAEERTLAAQAQSLRDLVRRSAPRPSSRSAITTRRSAPLPESAARLVPASSTLVHAFGQSIGKGGAAHIAQGMTLGVRAGSQIHAPMDAEVAYAGPFRSYGLVLILNLEGDYALVLAGADTLLARPGQKVLAGQPIAEMGSGADDPAAGDSAAQSVTRAPELYVEVRRAGVPVDPAGLLAARQGANRLIKARAAGK